MNVYPFIEAEKAQQRTVKRACELLEVSRAASYAHRADTGSARQLADDELTSSSAKPTKPPRAATARPGSTPNCVDAAIGTPESAWPD